MLTHNQLSSHLLAVELDGLHLRLQATEVHINPAQFGPDFVWLTVPKVQWVMFLEAADTLHLVKVTKGSIYRYEHHVKFLRKMHYILLEVDVLESIPQRPESEHPFPISCRIPSMLWNGEEMETIPYQAPVFYSPTMYIFNNVYYCLLVLLCVPNC